MSVESSGNAKEIFLAAIDIESAEERVAFLEETCGRDELLRRRVDALILAHEAPESLLNHAAPKIHDSPSIQPTVESVASEYPGARIGPYKLLQQLGEGGMGIVYLAEREEPVKQRVALKVIKHGMDSKKFIARFEAERQALAMMDHPNIAKVLDAGCSENGRPYFVMELVKGVPISEFCDENRLTTRERLELFTKVCQAVHHAHQKGIIHRDLKPTNVLVALYDDKPVPKVIDFGVAKATNQQLTDKTLFTEVGSILGTWEYMSPEQAVLNQLDVDTRTDVYSLGVLLYELLTGETPLDKTRLRQAQLHETLRMIREEEPPKPSTRVSSLGNRATATAAYRKSNPDSLASEIRGDLDWIVMKSLAKDRSRRYESASHLGDELTKFLRNEVVDARPPSTWYQLQKFYQRNRTLSLATITVATLVVCGFVIVSSLLIYIDSQNDRLAHALEDISVSIMDNGVSAALSGDTERAKEAIAFLELDGATKGDALLLRALLELNRGNFAEAKKKAVDSREADSKLQGSERLGASAIISAAEIWGGFETREASVHELIDGQPQSEFEALLKAYACAVYAPAISIQILEDHPKIIQSPVGLFVKGQAELFQSVDQADEDGVDRAVRTLEQANFQMLETENSVMLRVLSLNIAIGHALDDRKVEYAERLIQEAAPWVRKDEVANVPCNSAVYYLLTDQPENSLAIGIRQNVDTHCEYIVTDCLVFGDYDDAHDRYQQMMVGKEESRYTRMNEAHVVRGLPDGKSRARLLLDGLHMEFESSFDSRFALLANCLVRSEVELEALAKEVAAKFADETYHEAEIWREANCIRYLANVDNFDEEKLIADAGTHRYSQSQAHSTIAFKYLARGNREMAKFHFEKTVNTRTVGSSDHDLAVAYLKRMEADDQWPHWLNERETGE